MWGARAEALPAAMYLFRTLRSTGGPAGTIISTRRGFFSPSYLLTFRSTPSRLQGHPNHTKLPGVEIGTGRIGFKDLAGQRFQTAAFCQRCQRLLLGLVWKIEVFQTLRGGGPQDLPSQFFGEFALGSTATFPVIVKNALNKRLANAWKKYGAAGYDWWSKIVTVEHFETLNQIDWMILGTIGSLPSVAEQGEYTELPIGDNGETSDWTKYGGYVGLTLEAILRDDVRAFKRLPDEVAMGGMRNISIPTDLVRSVDNDDTFGFGQHTR